MVNTEILCKATLLYNRNIEVMAFLQNSFKGKKCRKLAKQYTKKPQVSSHMCICFVCLAYQCYLLELPGNLAENEYT